MNLQLAITIKQYVTQKAALRYCEKNLTVAIMKRRFGENVKAVVNQLDSNVFQVELVGYFKTPVIDLIGL
jgi:hypothetical protein